MDIETGTDQLLKESDVSPEMYVVHINITSKEQ